MKLFLGMIFSGGGTSLLNLIALTIIASRIDLVNLDIYFIYRDVGETVIKFFFVSQIGFIVVSEIRNSNGNYYALSKTIIWGLVILSIVMIIWLFSFNMAAEHILPNDQKINGEVTFLQSTVALFCIFSWLDSLVTQVIINRKYYSINQVSNFIGALLSCLIIYNLKNLTINDVAFVFSVTKLITIIPKLFICIKLIKNSKNKDKIKYTIYKKLIQYLPQNSLLQLNKYITLSGITFLQIGSYALYSIMYKYYTALQNLITVNLFNIASHKISNKNIQKNDIKFLLEMHGVAFLCIVLVISTFIYLIYEINNLIKMPEFLVSNIAPLLWFYMIISFLPDGINLILNRYSMIKGDSSWDSKISSAQATLNILTLYPAMKYMGINGLAYATLFSVTTFALIRSYKLIKEMPIVRYSIIRLIIYGLILLLTGILMLNQDIQVFCSVISIVSTLLLFIEMHRIYNNLYKGK